mgnify:FL=1|tara:strand:+ start:326 stop:934 length:609 start_codon:yes stop_codon:yes gene_type:complete
MTQTNTTELEAVNTILSAIGEAPINSLTGTLPIDATQAKNLLVEVSREVQAAGWHYNSFYDFSLSRDGDDKIPLAENIMRVDLDINKFSPTEFDVIKRGSFLFNKKENTFTFSKALEAKVVLFLPFDELPENARRYITIRAARMFQDRLLGANTLHGFQLQDELNALAVLKQEEADTADHSIFNNNDSYNIINRSEPDSNLY